MLSYFMGFIHLVRCMLELRCGMAVVVWYPYAGRSITVLLSYFMGCIVLVRCVLELRCGMAVVVWYPYAYGYGYHTHEITQHISRKLLRMDVLTSETC